MNAAAEITALLADAGRGNHRAWERLMPLVSDRPKAMLDVKGKSILARQVDALQQSGIRQIVVVRGYKKEQMNLPSVRYYDNDAFEDSGLTALKAGRSLPAIEPASQLAYEYARPRS